MIKPYLKHWLLCLAVLMVTQLCVGQSYRFQLKRTTECRPVSQADTANFYLTEASDTTELNDFQPQKGIINLPGKGTYRINLLNEEARLPLVKIVDTGLYVYEYRQPRITIFKAMHYNYLGTCSGSLNGYHEDRYSDGTLKMKGTFYKGRMKDSLVWFYANGYLKKRAIALRKETFIEMFDSLGHRSEVHHNSNKSFYLTDYKKTLYYPNGDIKLEEKRKGQVTRIAEFYPDGQLKTIQDLNTRAEYFANGKMHIAYKWKAKRERDRTSEEKHYRLVIEKTTYNDHGDILEFISYEPFRGKRQPYFDDNLDKNWIIRSVKYENGKEVFRVENIDAKEYSAKYPDH